MKGDVRNTLAVPRKSPLYILLVVAALVRLPGISDPLVYANDWANAQFLVFARNYHQLGWMVEWTIPCFGEVNGRGVVYANHPWLASLLLGVWGLPFGYSEFSYRTLALIFTLVTIVAIFNIGNLLGGQRVGLLAAAFFAFAPLSFLLGRTYCMEPVHIAFLLISYLNYLKWLRDGTHFPSTLAFLALAQLSDIYALFFSAWIGLLWLKDWKTMRAKFVYWLALFMVPVLTQLMLIAVLSGRSFGKHSWERGISRYGKPWVDWIDSAYWLETLSKLLWNYAYLLPVIGLVGFAWKRYRTLPGEQSYTSQLGFLWFYPTLYTLVCTDWMKNHTFLVVFWGPVISLQAALVLRNFRANVQATALAIHLFASAWQIHSLYLQPIPLHYQELGFAENLRRNLKNGDVVVGLPAHLAYYVNHEATLPYDYFLRGNLNEPDQLNDAVRAAVGTTYNRIIIVPNFIQYPESLKAQDLAHLFPETSPYRLVHKSTDLYIFEKIQKPSSRLDLR